MAVILTSAAAMAQTGGKQSGSFAERLHRPMIISEQLAEVMGSSTYADAGIAELSTQQQAVLLNWLQGQRGKVTAVPPSVPLADPSSPDSAPPALGSEQLAKPKPPAQPESDVESNIVGEFRGWSGTTRFRLANGQVWQQRVAGRYKVRLESPRVRIEKSRFGYRLSMVNSRGKSTRSVGVKRIR